MNQTSPPIVSAAPRPRLIWIPVALAVVGVVAAALTGGTHATRLDVVGSNGSAAVASGAPVSTSPPVSVASTTTTAVPDTAPPPTTPASTTPPAASEAVDLCPCDPNTGEPLGGAAIDKGVDGIVTSSAGQPLAGVCVTVDKPMPVVAVTTTTGPDGRFRIDLGKTDGPPLFQLDVGSCDGSWEPWLPEAIYGGELDPNTFNHIHATLHRAATLAGTAVDQNGKPYVGGCVAVSTPDRRVEGPIDKTGHFKVGGVPIGTFTAEIAYPCGGPPPPTTDGSASPMFTMREGQTTTAHLTAWRYTS